MISRTLLTLILSTLLALNVQCSWQTEAREENSLGIVRFPEPWTKTVEGRTVAFIDTRGFEVRKKIGSQPEELIFAMRGLISDPQRNRSDEAYSDVFYAVSLDDRFSVRAASAGEWERGGQLSNTREGIRSNKLYKPPSEPATHTEDGVNYRGKIFTKTGQFWGNTVGLVSPNGAWLAVFSFSSSAKPRRSWSALDGGGLQEPMPGEMFVDVYHTSSAERVLKGRAQYQGSPSMLFDAAFWVGNSYLVVPLDPVKIFDAAGQACFLGILP